MSETILKEIFARPSALTQSKNYLMVNAGDNPKYVWDFYPLAQPYYHEFNPYFVHLIQKEEVFSQFRIFTVRDGIYAFADFLVKNLKQIPKWKTLFLIPAEYTPLVPKILRPQFLCYSTGQVKRPDLKKAKKVSVFALMCDQYFGNYETVEKKLEMIKELPADAGIQVCMSLRKNPLLPEEKENLHYIHLPEMVRKAAGKREIQWVRLRDFMDQSSFKDHVLLDLLEGQKLTCDSFLHYKFLQRGGTVMGLPVWQQQQSLFELDICFNQKLQVHSLPDVADRFAEILFFAKSTKMDLVTYPFFHSEVVKALAPAL
ncbi:MAG: hypothetical protein ACJ76H_02040 [Bacteriovoracaceae bacterium]